MSRQLFLEIGDSLTEFGGSSDLSAKRMRFEIARSKAGSASPGRDASENEHWPRLFKFKPRPNEYDEDVREIHSEQFQPWEPSSTPPPAVSRSSQKHPPD